MNHCRIKPRATASKVCQLFAVAGLVAACVSEIDDDGNWESRNHAVSIEGVGEEWEVISGYDLKDDLLVGLIDESDGASFVVQIDSEYRDALRESDSEDIFRLILEYRLLEMNSSSVLSVDSTEMFGRQFQRHVITVYNEKWGKQMHNVTHYLATDDRDLLSIAWSYPCETNKRCPTPPKIERLQSNVSIKLSGLEQE